MSRLRRRPPTSELAPWFEFRAQADDHTAELRIFGPIGGGFFFDEDAVTAKSVVEQLDALDDSITTIRVLVDSPGGSVWDAVHIANALKRQRDELGRNVEADIEAIAASAATIITSACNPVRMPANALMMVHNPWGVAIGDANLMREMGDVLDKVRNTIVATYQWLVSKSDAELQTLMDATTWMEADEAVEHGFATEIAQPVEAAAATHLNGEALEHIGEIPEKYRAFFAFDEDGDGADGDSDEDGSGEEDPPEDEDGDDVAGDNDSGQVSQPETDEGEPDAGASKEPSEEKTMTDEEKKAAAKAAKLERARIQGITEAAATAVRAGLDQARVDELVAKAIGDDDNDGTTVDEFRNKCFEELEAKSADTGPTGGQTPDFEAGEDESEKRIRGIEAALLSRQPQQVAQMRKAAAKLPDAPAFQNIDVDGGEFRGLSLVEHIKADLDRMKPGTARGLHSRRLISKYAEFMNSGNYQTTSDFTVGLENVMHKMLLAAYAIAPDTWTMICATGEVSDFRAHPRYRTGYIASLDQIFEHGEFTSKTIPDAAKETITALTYGNIVGLSRQAIVDDDLGMFSRTAAQVGRAAALTIESGLYTMLALNSGLGPAMNDGNPLFDASHSNLGGGAALSAAAVDADATIMAAQQDPNTEEYLDIRPSRLLVPRGLRGTAITINESQFEPDTAASNKPNVVLGLFDMVVATPRLTGTRRYMFADPADMPCIEVAFLGGEQEPYVEMRDGWTTDGVEWKVRHDFGIAPIEFRAGLTDAGA